jgi:hypothetical protein
MQKPIAHGPVGDDAEVVIGAAGFRCSSNPSLWILGGQVTATPGTRQ